jgi:hypothetical protein
MFLSQHFVRVSNFLKFLFCLGLRDAIVVLFGAVIIGMELQGLLSVGFLDLVCEESTVKPRMSAAS